MKKSLLGILALACAFLATSNFAKADQFSLTVQNGGLGSEPSPYGTVTVLCSSSTSCTIEFQAAGIYEFHNAGVGWNETLSGGATISSQLVTTCTTVGGATCGTVGGPTNFDGFGNFTNSVGGGTGSSSGMTDVIITITGTNLSTANFESDNGNAQFAVQVAPYLVSNCTGFAANENLTGNQPSSQAGSGCTSTDVPEPGSLALFGTGARGLAGYLRRKLFA